jgi:hypothetical protein
MPNSIMTPIMAEKHDGRVLGESRHRPCQVGQVSSHSVLECS